MQPPPSLDLDRAAKALLLCPVGHTLDYHPAVASTMPLAHQLALRPDMRSGAVVLADLQHAGRGRHNRTWQAPPGSSLLLSIVLKERGLPRDPSALPMIAGLAVARALAALPAIKQIGLRVALKWPNDVLLIEGEDDARSAVACKVAGILIETTLHAAQFDPATDHAVVGIGINVTQSAAQLPHVEPPAPTPTSLMLATGAEFDRTDLLIGLCRAFAELLGYPAPALRAAWRQALWTLNRPVTVYDANGAAGAPLSGTAVGVTDRGSLIVEDADGERHVVDAGDVSLREDAL